MAAKAGKRPLRSLSVHEKLNAIRRVHDGESKASVARDIGVPESTLRGWCKNEDKISYLSRQSSSPETDESLEQCSSKRPKLEDLSVQQQPFNLSMKTNGASYSPTSSTIDYNSKPPEAKKEQTNKTLNKDSAKSSAENERTKAELARLSVELGLNRPEMFSPKMTGGASANMAADLSANINLLVHWNSLMQKAQQQLPQVSINKPSSSIETNGVGLLTTVDQTKSKLPSNEKQSVNESVWYWLKTQQRSMLGMNHPATTVPNIPSTSTLSPPISIPTSAATTMAPFLNNSTSEQSSWFWNWYKQLAYSQLPQQIPQDSKPILYQQLTKDSQPQPSSPQPALKVADHQQNVENLSMHPEKLLKTVERPSNGIPNNHKTRSVLDNLLFNNNNNVAWNKKDVRDAEESNISQIEALEHGEKFLKWLEECSDPSVTAMQIMQFRTLLNNVKSGADRRNGEPQNKTKVKRK